MVVQIQGFKNATFGEFWAGSTGWLARRWLRRYTLSPNLVHNHLFQHSYNATSAASGRPHTHLLVYFTALIITYVHSRPPPRTAFSHPVLLALRSQRLQVVCSTTTALTPFRHQSNNPLKGLSLFQYPHLSNLHQPVASLFHHPGPHTMASVLKRLTMSHCGSRLRD